MQNAKWIITLLLLALGLYLILMEQAPKKHESGKTKTESTIQKRFDAQNRLKSDATVVNGKREGVAHNYYEDGTIHSEINYENDIKHGNSTWFYPNGKPYRITPFVHGKKMGIQKKYHKSGVLMAEIPYQNNEILPGTKEYTENGQLKDEDATYTINAKKDKLQPGLIKIEITGKKLERIEYIRIVFDSDQNNDLKLKPKNSQEPLQFSFNITDELLSHFNCYVVYKTPWNNLKALNQSLELN